MNTFDSILPRLRQIFESNEPALAKVRPLVVNRDLFGRVRLVADEKHKKSESLKALAEAIHEDIVHHSFPPENAVLFEPDIDEFIENNRSFPLDGIEGVHVIDRLATETDWAQIAPSSEPPPRIVFYSVKGGVGRSTALAATAWRLAEKGLKVLVLDLDLESPGLSASLLPEDRRPAYGVVDWLVEDLVGNEQEAFGNMVATSELSRNGEIFVVPAHGNNPGEYISKLGRVWMPGIADDGTREPWSKRLARLLDALEEKHAPDVVLLDSRAGIDEGASACLTDLGASLILFFAIDSDQTWAAYRILFNHWRKFAVEREIRQRLQIVASMVPETDAAAYLENLRQNAWNLFSEYFYDEVPPGEMPDPDGWSFDLAAQYAPHDPLRVNWHRGFASMQSLHGRLAEIDPGQMNAVFGGLFSGILPYFEI
jgi:hypothetical protein